MMQKFMQLKAHLADNKGDENIAKLIWIVIAFVVGAAMLVIFNGAFKEGGSIDTWLDGTISAWFNKDTVTGYPQLT